jgi:hypothetical protein
LGDERLSTRHFLAGEMLFRSTAFHLAWSSLSVGGEKPTSEIWEKRTDNMKGVDNKTFTCASPREGIGSLLNYNKNPRL